MSGYIKYFDNGRKNMHFKTDDDRILIKYNEIRNIIKNIFKIKFYSNPVYDEKYKKTKVKSVNWGS